MFPACLYSVIFALHLVTKPNFIVNFVYAVRGEKKDALAYLCGRLPSLVVLPSEDDVQSYMEQHRDTKCKVACMTDSDVRAKQEPVSALARASFITASACCYFNSCFNSMHACDLHVFVKF